MRAMSVLTVVALMGCRATLNDTFSTLGDLDNDGYDASIDCDDLNPDIHPDADERCDGIDNNCDGIIDGPDAIDAQPYFADDDGDGHGSSTVSLMACEPPSGHTLAGDDCDDSRSDIYPGALEDDCGDPTDYNCDGSVGFVDYDNDGFSACEDCDDRDATISPDAVEVVYDGIDNDCDPLTRDDDLDDDGYVRAIDCDDTDDTVNNGALEVPYNGVDDDCNPITPDDDLDHDGHFNATDCDDRNPDVSPDMWEIPYNGLDDDCDPTTPDDDLDGDGYPNATDCDDTRADVHPGATEQPYNGIDDDCDPTTLDDDLDGDGFPGAVDCNDLDPAINPSADEIEYNGIDDDCRESTRDDDVDNDGYLNADDCDDHNAAINPGVAEIWYDGVDSNCDGADDYDQDGDGRQAFGTTPTGDDCVDTDPNASDCGMSPESALPTCADIHDIAPDMPTGRYWIDPDGSDPTEVTCDMDTDGGGWTLIEYSADLAFSQHFTGGDSYRWLPNDFTTVLSDTQIDALRDVSSEGQQTYVGQCRHVIHYRYKTADYSYAIGFRFQDGSLSRSAQSDYGPTIAVTNDGCQPNDSVDRSTTFQITSLSVPVRNISTRDSGDTTPERFGSQLTAHPARMR